MYRLVVKEIYVNFKVESGKNISDSPKKSGKICAVF